MTVLDALFQGWRGSLAVNPIPWFTIGVGLMVGAIVLLLNGRVQFFKQIGGKLVRQKGLAFEEKRFVSSIGLFLFGLLIIGSSFPYLSATSITYNGGGTLPQCSNQYPVLGYACSTTGQNVACTPSNIGTSTCRPANTASMNIGSVSTTSTSIVSTGVGVTVTVKTSGAFLVSEVIQYDQSGSTLVTFSIDSSTVGIPVLGNAPAGGDTNLGTMQSATPANGNALTLSQSIILSGQTGTVYFYAAFYTSAGTLNIESGRIIALEI